MLSGTSSVDDAPHAGLYHMLTVGADTLLLVLQMPVDDLAFDTDERHKRGGMPSDPYVYSGGLSS